MIDLRFVFLLGFSAAAHLCLLWSVADRRPPQLQVAAGEVCVHFALSSGATEEPIPSPAVTEPRPSPPSQVPPAEALPQPAAEPFVAIDDSGFFAQRLASEKLPAETPPAPEQSAVVPPRLAAPPSGAPSSALPQGVRSRASLLGNPRPVYPREAQLRGIEGTVMVGLHVSAEGKVIAAELHHSSGYSVLDEAALRFARTLMLNPAREAGKPVASRELLPVYYRLYDSR